MRPLDEGWMEQARCRDLAPDWEAIDNLFHSPGARQAGHRGATQETARAMCASCPVRRCCLEYAIALETQPCVLPDRKGGRPRTDEKVSGVDGMWGGVTATERASTRGMSLGARLDALEAIHARKLGALQAVGG